VTEKKKRIELGDRRLTLCHAKLGRSKALALWQKCWGMYPPPGFCSRGGSHQYFKPLPVCCIIMLETKTITML